jgi:hypothetical protein
MIGAVPTHRHAAFGFAPDSFVLFPLPRGCRSARGLRREADEMRRGYEKEAQMRTIDIGRQGVVAVMLAVAVTSGIASAAQDVDGRVAAARRIIMWDNELITPSALTMSQDDRLEFENDSGQLMRLVFVEPQDQTDKIRCYPIDHTIARPDQAPWLLFDWGPGRRLTANIPPGKFASACTLVPGQYAFVARRVSRDPRGPEDSFGTKGTITVK